MNQEIRVAPNNIQAEQALIGGLLLGLNSPEVSQAMAMLKADSFYHFSHKTIFSEIQFLANRNQSIDLLTVSERLKNINKLTDVGGFAYLAELSKNTPSVANIVEYARIVRDEAVKRFTLEKLVECEALILSNNRLSVEERLDTVSKLMSEIADHSRTGKAKGLQSARQVADKYLEKYQQFFTNPEGVKGLSSGLVDLDKLIGVKNLVRQSLAVVGARPKCGKTAFYAMLANSCVMNDRKTALLFSLEMSAEQIFERMIAQRMNLNTMSLYDINKPQHLQDEDLAKLSQGISDLVKSDLMLIDDTPNVSIAHIRNECRRIKRERGEIGLIAVDYLTLMKAEAAERNDLAYGNITKDLKNLAREMDCVVLLLTQLNRNLESRADKRPLPSDSRDTGQIEQECDYWFGLYKESVYNPNADKQLTEIHLRLNRHGETGKVYCDQRFGAMFPCDQVEAEKRAEIGKPEPKFKKTRYSREDLN